MRNKLLCIILALLITVTSFAGCTTKTSETQKGPFKVSNNGGAFSNKDLIYFVMPDRFYDGDTSNNANVDKSNPQAFHGGDIKGLTEKLDYIKSLGTTAIWITPVAQNDANGYHGYWINDFYKIDPHLGKMSDVQKFVKEAHKRNIKVLFDYVANHTGAKTTWLTDGKHENWFHPQKNISNYDDRTECENGWLSGLPDLNQENPEVSKYLIDNALWLVKKTGIDGMRLDTVKHVPKDFWNKFAYEIKQKYPDFYLIGEVWSNDVYFMDQYHTAGIDGLVDYPMYYGMRDAFNPDGDINSLVSAIHKQTDFSNQNINGLFLDNHDNKRFINGIGSDGEKYLRLALAFEMTYPAIPIIYYGTEIAMDGGSDPDNRRDMQWDKVDSSSALKEYKKLVELRNRFPALLSKDFRILDYDNDFIAYLRGSGDNTAVIIINRSQESKNIIVNFPDGMPEYQDINTKESYKLNNGQFNLTIKPLDYLILQPK